MSSVIKAGHSGGVVHRLTTIDLADHRAEAAQILQEARSEAQTIVTRARRDSAEAVQAALRRSQEEGYARGHAAGLEAGRAEGLFESKERFERESVSLRETLTRLVGELEASRRDLLIAARHDVLEFAVALARRVVKFVGEFDRGAAAENLREAVRVAAGQTDVVAHVNPADFESLRRFAAELHSSIASCEHIEIIEDPSITPGGCLVTTPQTRIDARIESQLEDIAILLLGAQRDRSIQESQGEAKG